MIFLVFLESLCVFLVFMSGTANHRLTAILSQSSLFFGGDAEGFSAGGSRGLSGGVDKGC